MCKPSICMFFILLLSISIIAGENPRQTKFDLLDAIDNCNITKIQEVIEGNTLEVLEKTGNSIENIHVAVFNSCPPSDFCKILPILVEKGSDLNKRIGSGEALLHQAVRRSNLTAVKCLLINSADPNRRIKDGKRMGKSPIQLAKELREREIYAILTEKEDDSTSIQKMVEQDDLELFITYFQKEKSELLKKDQLLIEASKNGSLKITEFLLKQGANPNFIEESGYGAYFYAVSYADSSMLNTLLDYKLNINEQNSNNSGPIAWLFKSHQPISLNDQGKIAKLLIENGLKKEACNKGFKHYKDRYGVYTKQDAIEHDKHLGGSDYVYVYDMLDSCKAP